MERVEHRPAVHARVQVALGHAHGHEAADDPAQPDRHRRGRRGRACPSRRRSPRRPCARRARTHSATASPRDLLLALDEHADVDRQLAGPGHRAGDVEQRQEVALVVGRAARVEAAVALGGLERRRGPGLRGRPAPGRRSGRRSGRWARRGRRPELADGQRVALADDHASASPPAARTRSTTHSAARASSGASPPSVETDGMRSQSSSSARSAGSTLIRAAPARPSSRPRSRRSPRRGGPARRRGRRTAARCPSCPRRA